jgi:hypothetical protein
LYHIGDLLGIAGAWLLDPFQSHVAVKFGIVSQEDLAQPALVVKT